MLSPELQYILLVLALFVVPKPLQRFRVPSAITCLVIGASSSIGFHLFHDDHTVKLLATLGIVTMFLFAGLEVDFAELREGRRVLLQHVAAQIFLLIIGTVVFKFTFGLEPRLFGALILFTLVATLLPGFALRTPPAEYDTPEVPREPHDSSTVMNAASSRLIREPSSRSAEAFAAASGYIAESAQESTSAGIITNSAIPNEHDTRR